MTEIYKFLNDLPLPIMNYIFQKYENYCSLKNPRSLVSKRKFTATNDIDTISFGAPQIWYNLPQYIKNSDSLKLLYGTLTCNCKILKTFVPCVVYVVNLFTK